MQGICPVARVEDGTVTDGIDVCRLLNKICDTTYKGTIGHTTTLMLSTSAFSKE